MNKNIDFLREYRTSHSEVYSVYLDEHEDIDGRLDLHYLDANNVTGLLCLYKEYPDEDIVILLQAIDDKIVNMADIDKGNFTIEVYTVTDKRAFGTQREE